MVDFSLKKTKNNWKSSNKSGPSSPLKQSTQDAAPSQPLSVLPTPIATNTSNGNDPKIDNKPGNNNNANPYSGMHVSNQYNGLLQVNAHEKNKAASSMHRRLSMYNSKNTPASTDYSIPLPGGISSLPGNNVNQMPVDNNLNTTLNQFGFKKDTMLDENRFREIIQTKNLRLLLSNENFNAKDFVRTHLSNASAMDIDQFTTVLNELSQNIQVEVKDNINRSYKEILQVNRDLNVATDELKTLRENMQNLNYVISDFADMADRRIAREESNNQDALSLNSSNVNSTNLLPPVSSASGNNNKPNESTSDAKRDMTSVYIMGKMWNSELIELEKEIEGATNFLETKGRHLIVKSEDWYELNATTLRYLQTVRIYIFNDIILITGKNKNNGYALKQTLELRECFVERDIRDPNKLIFKSTNNSVTSMYECRSPREVNKVVEAIRRAKDDLCDIFQSEMQNEERLRESFRFLQTTQQTPAKDQSLSKSPAKNQRHSLNNGAPNNDINDNRNSVNGDPVHTYKINNKIINYSDLFTDQHLLQSLTISMRANMRSVGMGSYCNQLLALDSHVEEVDITIARARYANAVSALMEMKKQLYQMRSQLNETETNFFELLMIKIGLRCDSIYRKLVTNLNTNTEISQLLSDMNTMIELDKAEEGLELFLQNRSDLIQDLILHIGSFDNPTNYLTHLSVIRFQIMRQTVLNYKDLFKIDSKTHHSSSRNKEMEKSRKELSSILVNWCNVEVDKHFQLINEQLLNNEMISPSSIKSSRKQIDELKSVGLDFVYKLDEFIRANNHRIG